MALARPVDCGSISVLCTSNTIFGPDSAIQGPLPSQSVRSWLLEHFSAILTSSRCLKRKLWGSDFDKNQCSIPNHHFCKNSRFASTRTQFSRFREPGSHAKIILNLMQNGTWQLTMSKTPKAKLWSRDFVLHGVCGTTRMALRGAQSRSKSHPSSPIRQISVPFRCSGSH